MRQGDDLRAAYVTILIQESTVNLEINHLSNFSGGDFGVNLCEHYVFWASGSGVAIYGL